MHCSRITFGSTWRRQKAHWRCRHCFRYLKPGAKLRIAVPDGYHPDPALPGACAPLAASGPSAEDHRLIYDHESLRLQMLQQAGFTVELLGVLGGRFTAFHRKAWKPAGRLHQAFIPPRQAESGWPAPTSTSLIVDDHQAMKSRWLSAFAVSIVALTPLRTACEDRPLRCPRHLMVDATKRT